MKSKNEIPSGFTYGDYSVLVPTSIASLPAHVSAASSGSQDPMIPTPAQENASQAHSHSVRKGPREKRLLQVYSEQDVRAFESSTESMSRSNERRKNADAMIRLMRRSSPVGQRHLARVPRNYQKALNQIEEEMPNFTQLVATIRRLLALQVAGDGSFQLPPMLLAGEPGVGKTYFALRLAKIMGTGFDMISMEGASSPMSLIGLEPHYYSSSPGKVFDVLVQGNTANPVFVVDELDKASSEARFPPANALYQLLESETAKTFSDQCCLQVKLDASRISWVVTANDLSAIPVPILSRLMTFHVPAPNYSERVRIAGSIYRDLRCKMAWGKRFQAVLPRHAAGTLAGVAASVRPMKAILRLACANALLRKSTVVEALDIMQALRCSQPLPDLEDMDVQGTA